MRVIVDGYTRFLLTSITVLLTVVAVGLWYESPGGVASAEAAPAGIPNQGQQLAVLIEKTETTNAALLELNKILLTGAAKVQVVEPAKKKPTPQQ